MGVDAETLTEVFELWNRTPDEDLAGLSPAALAELLEDPFEATDVLVFADVLPRSTLSTRATLSPIVPLAPVATLLAPVFQALAGGPVRATANGYLPRSLCVEVEEAVFERHGVLPLEGRRATMRSESAFVSLHLARVTAASAGLLRLYRGAFVMTRKGRSLHERHGMAGLYPALLRAFATRIEWSSLDAYPRAPIVQASFAFSLTLLARYGRVRRPAGFYAERWQRAFPGVVEEFRGTRLGTRRDAQRFADCYETRVLERFMWFFGLAELSRERPGASSSVRATKLLFEVLALRQGG